MACSKLISQFTLEEICCCLDTYEANEEVLDYLETQLDRVEATCNQNDMSTDLCQRFLCVLSKALKCRTKSSKVIQILSSIRESRLLQTHITKCLQDLNESNNQAEILQTLAFTIDILNELLQRMPQSLPQNFELVVFISNEAKKYINSNEENSEWSEFDEINNKAKILRNAVILEISKPIVNNDDGHSNFTPPPDNFREISIFPCISDVFPTSDVYLRPIIKKGSYQNLDHYLDVQFRLYREDCLSPLREGIAEYISQRESGKREVYRLQDLRLYKNVRITNKEITLDGAVYWIELDPHHSSRIRWESSKRLQYGSLVCLSSNDFKSLLFAIVTDSDRKMLQDAGQLKVQFSTNIQIPLKSSKMTFTMVETTSYFEAYRHVLAGLQNIHEGNFPFERYIVHCKKDVLPPFYLRGECIAYDLMPVIDKKNICLSKDTSFKKWLGFGRMTMQLNNKERNVDILNGEWPSAEDLHLDTSQYDAFKSALTEEFVLIQGPPGTGKTHVGLQIVKVLLHNREHLSLKKRGEASRPLMIVCFTNHALDQFMEGIVGFISANEAIDHIVRVGGKCANPTIEQFTLKKKRRKNAGYKNQYKKLIKLQECISKKKWQLRMSKQVIFGAILEEFVEEKFKNLFQANKENDQGKANFLPLYNWLGVTERSWMTMTERKFENFKQQPNIREQRQTQQSESENIVRDRTDVINVKSDADIIKEDRQIEEEELLVRTEFDEDLGLDLKKQLNLILKSARIHKSKAFLDLLSVCANDSLEELTKEDDYMLEHEVSRAKKNDIWKMPFLKRWKLYRYWLHKYKQVTEAALTVEEEEFKTKVEEYKNEKALEDQQILQRSSVIAITTTGAARYQDVLSNVGPKIIIVEEAAEVLEAHIVSTLSPRCEHLILIGDHKQLEPKPAVFELARKYNLSLSMFERMIKNGLSYHCLQRQHRMRPEISKLVRHIYPVLEDNDNVLEYGHIGGVKNDVFFLNHNHRENFSDDSRTYSNQYEAEFIPKLCSYLMKQGYKASQITVLAAYTGQLFCIKNLMPKSEFEGIRVCVLDNYQGEENDIIILSLVRNNANNIVGFLKRENRTCVALSRAKKGLYILGNMKMLKKSSKLWNKVFHDLESMNAIGEELQLFCQNHPNEQGILAKNPRDFEKAPDGGCNRKCDFRHPCGHACQSYCHPVDPKHTDAFKCKKPCPLICEKLHPCPYACHYPTSCDCQVQILKHLPCGHKATMSCCIDPKVYTCKEIVEVTYTMCKHESRMECWKSFKLDEFQCTVEVKVKHPRCGHDMLIPCFKSEDTDLLTRIGCMATCDKMCENEHSCKKICHHPSSCSCIIKMTKSLRCGHSAEMMCYQEASTHKCEKKVPVTYAECKHETSMECWKSEKLDVYECRENVTVTHPKCGHDIQVECCYSKEIEWIRIKTCKAVCNKLCENGHNCQKTCHFPLRCDCKEPMEKPVPACGHIQTMPCNKNPLTFNCLTVVTKEVPGCGHYQEMPCHLDPELYKCTEVVEKHCSNSHAMEVKCSTQQYEIDLLCKELMQKQLPKCQHKASLPCNQSVYEHKCEEPVEKRLKICFHKTILPCHQSVDGYKCTEIIDIKQPDCGHFVQVKCSDNPEKQIEIRTAYLKGLSRTLLDRKHISYPKCTVKTQISCSKGHSREVICGQRKKSKCQEQCGEELPCGHKCSGICTECEENNHHCTCNVTVVKKCKNDHESHVQCSKLSAFVCKVKCNALLACGHQCTGLCNECAEGMMHRSCEKVCKETMICGHGCFHSPCGTCRLCNMECRTRCGHGSCTKSCSEVCNLCTQECTWSCSHMKCTRLCYEPCDIEFCTKPCQRKLRCGHKCLGYCGDLCPRLCRICNKQQFQQLSRHLPRNSEVFVVILPDCGHEFNSVYIDHHINDRISDDVGNIFSEWPKCPTCQTIIQWHPRYGNKIKKQRDILLSVKQQIFQYIEDFPLKVVDDSLSYLKEFDTFCSRLYDIDDTGIEYLLSDVMPEVDVLLSNLECIRRYRRISCQQILDIRCCMITTGIVWMVMDLLSDTETENESTDQWLDNETKRQKQELKPILDKIIESSCGFMECVERRLQFLGKPTHRELAAVQKLITVTSQRSFPSMRNVPLIDTPRMDVHCRDWMICKKGHTWSSSFNESKTCNQCAENVVKQDEYGDVELKSEPIESGILTVNEVANEENKPGDISNKNQTETDPWLSNTVVCRETYTVRKRDNVCESEHESWRQSENFHKIQQKHWSKNNNCYRNRQDNWRQSDDFHKSQQESWRQRGSYHESKQENWRQKDTEMNSNDSTTTKGNFAMTRNLNSNLKQRHEKPIEYTSKGEESSFESIDQQSSWGRRRGRGRGRPYRREQQTNSDTTDRKTIEQAPRGQGKHGTGEKQDGTTETFRNTSSGQRGRGGQFRGRWRERGKQR